MHRVWVKKYISMRRRRGRHLQHIIPKNQNTGVHLKVDEAVEGCTDREVRASR